MSRSWLIAAALAFSSPAFAYTCTGTSSLGALGPPAAQPFGKSFNGELAFSDCWQFSIAAASDVAGTITESNADFWFLPRYIDVQAVSLWDLVTDTQIGSTDLTPDHFEFTRLAAGSYALVVGGYATLGYGSASYAGALSTSLVGAVPEPSLPALLVLALGAAALAGRKGA